MFGGWAAPGVGGAGASGALAGPAGGLLGVGAGGAAGGFAALPPGAGGMQGRGGRGRWRRRGRGWIWRRAGCKPAMGGIGKPARGAAGVAPGLPGVGALGGGWGAPPWGAAGGAGQLGLAGGFPCGAAAGGLLGMPAGLPPCGGAFGMPAVAAPAGCGGGPGPWNYLPLAPCALQQLQLHPGAMLEVAACDSWGLPSGTAEFCVSGAWPADAAGHFVEATVEACSQAQFLPVLQGLFAMGASFLHLCARAVRTCHLAAKWPNRNVVPSDTVRVKAVPGDFLQVRAAPLQARAPQEVALAVQRLPMALTAEAAARAL
ncbi:unnamed protein product, partial [Prorocentrum cordatum]